jgi:hypothetical protein
MVINRSRALTAIVKLWRRTHEDEARAIFMSSAYGDVIRRRREEAALAWVKADPSVLYHRRNIGPKTLAAIEEYFEIGIV